MYGGRNGQEGSGSESAIHRGVRGKGGQAGAVDRWQRSSQAADLPRFHVHRNVGNFLMKEGAMGKKEAVPNRQCTEEFKAEAVRLGLSIGGNAEAKRLGIPQSTMTNWVRRSR